MFSLGNREGRRCLHHARLPESSKDEDTPNNQWRGENSLSLLHGLSVGQVLYGRGQSTSQHR